MKKTTRNNNGSYSGSRSDPRPDSCTVMFAGDSGDGIQLLGTLFATGSAKQTIAMASHPEYPAEIRAPAGTTYGVSAYTTRIMNSPKSGKHPKPISHAFEKCDVLVALNVAALTAQISNLKVGGTIFLDSDNISEANLKKANIKTDPRKDKSLDKFHVVELNMSKLTLDATKQLELGRKISLGAKNMWALGFVAYIFSLNLEEYKTWLETKFKQKPDNLKANLVALKAGYNFAETTEEARPHISHNFSRTDSSKPGKPSQAKNASYRLLNGSQAVAWGLVTAAALVEKTLLYASYPITPASPVLHIMSRLADDQLVSSIQSEDEISAACMALGASYSGNIGATTTSGPGLDLMAETIGLAVAAELPLIIVNAQRGGPSTGLPTKPEQSDLLQALWGRHGETPLPVIAASDPIDAYQQSIKAVELALTFMTPVILLSDAMIANASSVWEVPDLATMKPIKINQQKSTTRSKTTQVRYQAPPGTKNAQRRIGGLEKEPVNGNISYDPHNHQLMTQIRQQKINAITNHIEPAKLDVGKIGAKLLIISWGSPSGAAREASETLIKQKQNVAHLTLRNIMPTPRKLLEIIKKSEKVMIPEMNSGQLKTYLKSLWPIDIISVTQMKPFTKDDIIKAAEKHL